MVAIAAKLVLAEAGLATVTGAVDPHPDRLLDPECVCCDRDCPFARFQSEAIFRKQCPRFFFLQGTRFFGSQCHTISNGCGRWLILLDGLGDLSGNR